MDKNDTRNLILPSFLMAIFADDAKGLQELLDGTLGPSLPHDVLNEKTTLLHIAASCAGPDTVSQLLRAGANPSLVNGRGETPLDVTMREDVRQVLQSAISCRESLEAIADSKWRDRVKGEGKNFQKE